jgi:hypothetical protein
LKTLYHYLCLTIAAMDFYDLQRRDYPYAKGKDIGIKPIFVPDECAWLNYNMKNKASRQLFAELD